MPRFDFDIYDGVAFIDHDGMKLPHDLAAPLDPRHRGGALGAAMAVER